MPLSLGAKLGPYEILEPVGARGMGAVTRGVDSWLSLNFLELLRREPNRAVDRNAGTGEQGSQQISLISLGIRQKTSRFDRTAAPARNHKGKILAGMLIPILEAGAPH